jgi:dihydrofolate reductase
VPAHAREPLALVVAWARDAAGARVIGRGGSLPWHEPEDLRHFRHLTMGHALLMGRRTHESIGRPLPGRRNLVLTRDRAYQAPGCEVVGSLEEGLAAARTSDPCPFVIGGASLYAAALPRATLLFVTEVAARVAGDTFFPPWDEDAWRETRRREAAAGRLVFRTLERVPAC